MYLHSVAADHIWSEGRLISFGAGGTCTLQTVLILLMYKPFLQFWRSEFGRIWNCLARSDPDLKQLYQIRI